VISDLTSPGMEEPPRVGATTTNSSQVKVSSPEHQERATPVSLLWNGCVARSLSEQTGAIFIEHLSGKLKLREIVSTELQQNLRTLQNLKNMVGC